MRGGWKFNPLWKDESIQTLRFGRWQFWWNLLATIAAFAVAFVIIFAIAFGLVRLSGWMENSVRLDEALSLSASLYLGNPYTFFSFAIAGVAGITATWLAARVHGMSGHAFMTLYGGFESRRFWRMSACWFVTGLLFLGLSLLFYGEKPELSFRAFDFPVFIAAAVAVIAIQTFAEEALFRGYLYHSWVRVFPYPVLVTVFWSAVFASLHWSNPDVVRDPIPALIGLMVFALFAQWLTVRTGSLDAAWGMHFANNIYASLIVNVKPGYETDVPLLQFTDKVMAEGGSYAHDPMTYVWFALGWAVTFWVVLDRRSPFFVESR